MVLPLCYLIELAHILFSRIMRFDSKDNNLLAFISSDDSNWLKNQLQHLYDLLAHLVPSSMKLCVTSSNNQNFRSIHCDIWNRYSEKVIFCFFNLYIMFNIIAGHKCSL